MQGGELRVLKCRMCAREFAVDAHRYKTAKFCGGTCRVAAHRLGVDFAPACEAKEKPGRFITGAKQKKNAREVVALFVKRDSVYKKMLGAFNCYDEERDALTYTGGAPVVAHPPCQDYSSMSFLHQRNETRARLAVECIGIVRRVGGVLEHPAYSRLWNEQGLPKPGDVADKFGGYTVQCRQYDFGHVADKKTWLYIVRAQTPDMPPRRAGVPRKLWMLFGDYPPGMWKRWRDWREKTPAPFAQWLIDTAASVT